MKYLIGACTPHRLMISSFCVPKQSPPNMALQNTKQWYKQYAQYPSMHFFSFHKDCQYLGNVCGDDIP